MGEEEGQIQHNMPEKSPQLFGSYLAGVPAPLCELGPWELVGSSHQLLSVTLSCQSQMGPCEAVLLKKVLPCLLCLLCLEEKGQRQQLKSHLIPKSFELIQRKGAGVQRPKYPQRYVSTSLCPLPSLNWSCISLLSRKHLVPSVFGRSNTAKWWSPD